MDSCKLIVQFAFLILLKNKVIIDFLFVIVLYENGFDHPIVFEIRRITSIKVKLNAINKFTAKLLIVFKKLSGALTLINPH